MNSKISPIGAAVEDDIRQQEREDSEYREERARLERCETVARFILRLRMDRNLTQQEFAKLAGTTPQVISRLESGQHWPSLGTLRRIMEAAGGRLVVGYQATTSKETSPILFAV
ncbi:MAG: helix-turn-helix transcriptional regulator [Candidatus Dormibacteraceae bacterium]